MLARAVNSVPQFRQRIREDVPIEHESVHPGVTILCEGDVFRFSFLNYVEDFVPRLAWGRFEERDNRLLMPLNVQAHHALIDGIHIAKLITCLQELIRTANSIL